MLVMNKYIRNGFGKCSTFSANLITIHSALKVWLSFDSSRQKLIDGVQMHSADNRFSFISYRYRSCGLISCRYSSCSLSSWRFPSCSLSSCSFSSCLVADQFCCRSSSFQVSSISWFVCEVFSVVVVELPASFQFLKLQIPWNYFLILYSSKYNYLT